MTGRIDLLRAHVFAAFDVRGTVAFLDACRDVVDGYLLWPLIEYQHAFELARKDANRHRARIEQNIADAIVAIRESYVETEAVAA